MIIGTIVARYLADGTVIPGDGCDHLRPALDGAA